MKIGGKMRLGFDLVKRGKVLEGMEEDKMRGRASFWHYDLISHFEVLLEPLFC
jgi:hypothetical protein